MWRACLHIPQGVSRCKNSFFTASIVTRARGSRCANFSKTPAQLFIGRVWRQTFGSLSWRLGEKLYMKGTNPTKAKISTYGYWRYNGDFGLEKVIGSKTMAIGKISRYPHHISLSGNTVDDGLLRGSSLSHHFSKYWVWRKIEGCLSSLNRNDRYWYSKNTFCEFI